MLWGGENREEALFLLLFVCWVWREKERFGFDSVHVGAKGVVVVVGESNNTESTTTRTRYEGKRNAHAQK